MVKNDDDVDVLNKAFGQDIWIMKYPEMVCISCYDTTIMASDNWSTASDSIGYAKALLETLGYKVEVSKFDEMKG